MSQEPLKPVWPDTHTRLEAKHFRNKIALMIVMRHCTASLLSDDPPAGVVVVPKTQLTCLNNMV